MLLTQASLSLTGIIIVVIGRQLAAQVDVLVRINNGGDQVGACMPAGCKKTSAVSANLATARHATDI